MKKKWLILIFIIVVLAMMFIVKKEKLSINTRKQESNTNISEEIIESSNQGLVLYADDLIKYTNTETNGKDIAKFIEAKENDIVFQNAIKHNTIYLQSLIDEASNAGGGVVHIPAGTYYFAPGGMRERGTTLQFNYVILARSNVLIEGEGTDASTGTILKPYGYVDVSLDMFYFNICRDTEDENEQVTGTYIENADFKNFVIDSEHSTGTSLSGRLFPQTVHSRKD